MKRSFLPLAVLLPLVLAAAGLSAQQGDEKPAPPLSVEAVKVEPSSPAPDTLCRLSITLRNAGARKASAFEIAVRINGQELPAYKSRLYLQPIEPGATGEIRLFNFWSSETGRPAPPDGKLAVEVTLTRAAWVEKETKDGAETWTPAGTVEGLPVSKTVTLTMAKSR
ncbi:MAG TPA: CARDB domain-containing protein [Thermoanaerobaculia bacterium]|nr:CARDB domain-containing protein [Thermoanaerobaculia bacterium]